MDYFKNYTPQDLLDIQEMDIDDLNNFVNDHHYAICSVCGKEILYDESPVLTNDRWQTVLTHFNIKDTDRETHTVKAHALGSASAKLGRVNMILKKSESTIVCKDCMEEALGRTLHISDLPSCGMNKRIIKKFNITD